jgi:hypothetical protein
LWAASATMREKGVAGVEGAAATRGQHCGSAGSSSSKRPSKHLEPNCMPDLLLGCLAPCCVCCCRLPGALSAAWTLLSWWGPQDQGSPVTLESTQPSLRSASPLGCLMAQAQEQQQAPPRAQHKAQLPTCWQRWLQPASHCWRRERQAACRSAVVSDVRIADLS